MRLRAILDAFRSSPRRGRRDIAPACVDVSAAARGGDPAARERVEFDRRRSVPAVDSASRHACRGVERGGGLAGAERGRARSDAARVRDVSPRTVSTSMLARRRAEASSRHRPLRDARRNDGFNETRIFRHPCGVRFTRSVVTKRGWGGRARLGRRSARIAVRRGELCVTCGYADAVGGAAALFRTASRRSAAMRRAGRRDARAAYLRSSTTKS